MGARYAHVFCEASSPSAIESGNGRGMRHTELPSDSGVEVAKQFDQRWPQSYEQEWKQRENDQGNDHLDRGLRRHFFSPAVAFGTQSVRVHTQRRCDAGPKPVSLNQGCDKRSDIVHAGAICKIAQRLGPRLSRTHFEICQMKLFAQFGMRILQVFTHAGHCLIKRQPRLDAHHGQVQGVRETDRDLMLALGDEAFQHEAGKE